MSEVLTLGKQAAKEGKMASVCPFPTGGDRTEWLNGYFSIKVPTHRKGVRVAKKKEDQMPSSSSSNIA